MMAIVHPAMDPQVYKAAKLGDITLLRDIVERDPNRLLKVTVQGNTALHVSVRFGHLDFIKELYSMLLRYNTSLEGNTEYSRNLSLIKQVNSAGDIALHVAIREGHTSIAKFLIQKIMPWGCKSSDHDLEAANISLACETIRMRNKKKNTALHEAVQRNDVEMVMALIEADPHLGHPNYDADKEGGKSPLYLAAKDGRLDVINKILDTCPSAAHGGPEGQTALHVAVVEERLDVVEVLVHKKGDLVHSVDENGRTALQYAMVTKEHQAIARYLLEYDTSAVYQWDKKGLTPLHIAALKSTIGVIQEIIQRCPDSLELLDNTKHRNVLHFIVMSQDLDKVRYVTEQLEYKELINQADDDGDTPLHVAARLDSIKVMKHFVSDGREVVLDLNAKNNNGERATDICLASLPTHMHLVFIWIYKVWKLLPLSMLIVKQERLRIKEERIKRRLNEELINEQDQREKQTPAISKQLMEKIRNLQIVASLIATVTFAAVFQVPGGYNSSDGKPVLLNNKSFQEFLKQDAFAMSTSMASLITFVIASIYHDSNYISQMFLVGTIYLFISLIGTSAAFLAGFRAVLPHCRIFFCSYDPSIVTYSTIAASVIGIMLFAPILYVFAYCFVIRKLAQRIKRRIYRF